MAEVRVRISTGRKFLLDEQIQKAFPDDFVLDDTVDEGKDESPKPGSATAASANGGDKKETPK